MSIHNQFDAYEIAPWLEFENGACAPYPSLAAAEAADLSYCEATHHSETTRISWTLYGHHQLGGVSAIGDFLTYEDAAEIYEYITGCKAPANPDRLMIYALPCSPTEDNYSFFASQEVSA